MRCQTNSPRPFFQLPFVPILLASASILIIYPSTRASSLAISNHSFLSSLATGLLWALALAVDFYLLDPAGFRGYMRRNRRQSYTLPLFRPHMRHGSMRVLLFFLIPSSTWTSPIVRPLPSSTQPRKGPFLFQPCETDSEPLLNTFTSKFGADLIVSFPFSSRRAQSDWKFPSKSSRRPTRSFGSLLFRAQPTARSDRGHLSLRSLRYTYLRYFVSSPGWLSHFMQHGLTDGLLLGTALLRSSYNIRGFRDGR